MRGSKKRDRTIEVDTENKKLHFFNEKFPLVSLIVINYNGLLFLGDILDKCIESLLATEYPNLEIIIVDNGSTDHSVDYLMKKFSDKRLRIIPLSTNRGYVGGANQGARIAKGEIIGILNNDLIFSPKWLKSLISTFNFDSKIKIVCPKVLFIEKPDTVNSLGAKMNSLLLVKEIGILEKDVERKAIDYVFIPSGPIFLFPASLLREMGGILFDEDYFAYFEEVDFGWRVNMLGYRVACNSEAVVYHKGGGSFGNTIKPSQFYFCRYNALRTGIKNAEARIVLSMLPVWFTMTLYHGFLYYRDTLDPTFFKASFLAITRSLLGFKKQWRKRTKIQRIKDSRDLPFSSIIETDYTTLTVLIVNFVNFCLGIAKASELSIKIIKRKT